MDIIKKHIDELRYNQNHILTAIKYLDEKVKEAIDKAHDKESEDIKKIIESQSMMDKIIVKNSDDILTMKRAKEDNAHAIKDLDTKIDMINNEIESRKIKLADKAIKKVGPKSHKGSDALIKCELCDKGFGRFVDLETHVKATHENREEFPCDQCDKSFVVEWRLKKHLTMHAKHFIQNCHYFNNGKMCPFEEMGCKFMHVFSRNCKFGQRCTKRLCPLRHVEKEVNATMDTEIDIEEEQCSQNDADNNYESFVTSTPQKTEYQCDECENETQCTDCFVRETLGTGKSCRKFQVNFKDL